MEAYRKILLCLDLQSDESALITRACQLAQATGARLTALHVLPPTPGGLRGVMSDQELSALEGEYEQVVDELLSQRIHAVMPGFGAVEARCRQGQPFRQIILEATENRHDLVMVGADRGDSLRERLFGGTTLRLLRKCPAAVWVVKAGGAAPYARVLASVDLDLEHAEPRQLNLAVVEHARSLAEREGGELHLGHVVTIEVPPFSALTGEVPTLIDRAREQCESRMALLLARADIDEEACQVHLLSGRAGLAIPALAEELEAGVVVMGTVARTGLSGFLIGNTAESVLERINCSVLALKPEGFVSPVQPD